MSKWFQSFSISWLDLNTRLVNLIVGLLGFISILLGALSANNTLKSQVLLGLGASLLSSSIVAFLSSNYVLEHNRVKELAEDWGLSNIFETRSEMNVYSNRYLKREREKLDIIAFGLKGFRERQDKLIKEKVRLGVKIRIITISPNSEFLKEQEKCEDEVVGQMKSTIESLIAYVQLLQDIQPSQGQVEIKMYDSLPQDFYFGFKEVAFIGPYLYRLGSQRTISYMFKSNSRGYSYYSEYFERLWQDDEFLEEIGGH